MAVVTGKNEQIGMCQETSTSSDVTGIILIMSGQSLIEFYFLGENWIYKLNIDFVSHVVEQKGSSLNFFKAV